MPGIAKQIENQDELERELRAGFGGEVHVDRMTRGLYSTDASIYQQDPLAVVLPRDKGDFAHALEVARRRGLKVLPRGGGTSLAGQATGRCVVIDASKFMNRIIETNVEERWVRVEPGLVRDELNAALASTGLHFAPETATANRANVGGMIGNNSAGMRSIIYGKTVEHVMELTILLPTGEELQLSPMSKQQWDEKASGTGREGEIYRGVREVIEKGREEIAARFPKVMRRVGGYALDEFLSAEPWNLAKLIVGSEGTLAAVVEAKLRLEPLPAAKAISVVHFASVAESLRAIPAIVALEPSAVEILDKTVLDLARGNLEAARMCDWIQGNPDAVLMIEFFGENGDDVRRKIDNLHDRMRELDFGYAYCVMLDPAEQAKVWGVRQSGLGLMLGMKGDAKPTAFIEDSAVPIESLPDYIAEVLEVCNALDVPVAMYAHASVGLIHVRPILNLKDPEDVERMKTISEKTFELVRKYGGSWSGEHGDGLVRSYMNERFFGEKLYAAFRQIKKLFDPDGMMNPGKIVDAAAMDEDLRLGGDYRAKPARTFYRYRADGGMDRSVEMCTGVGECRKTLTGTMCPSYIATRDEAHSTRGRANALRLAMSGQLGPEAMTSSELHGVLDLCLGCKGCKAECPSNVDLAKLKGEFLAGYHARHGSTRAERFFANSPAMAARISGALAPLVNWLGERSVTRILMDRALGLERSRPLPKFAPVPFPKWFDRRRATGDPASSAVQGQPATGDSTARRVILFDDTFMNYHDTSVGRSAVSLLEALGYRVELARAGCCCRPLISHGFLEEATEKGLETLRRIDLFLAEGLPVVACEPSCLSALTDDLPDLIDDEALGLRVAEGVMMIDVFLERELKAGRLEPGAIASAARNPQASTRNFLIHGHCHQKALYGTRAMKTLFGLIEGASVEEIDSGCCGMAGSFGYEKQHYALSLKIGEDRLFPAIREMAPETDLIACGFSCRHQIADALGVRARHFVEAMAEAVGPPPS